MRQEHRHAHQALVSYAVLEPAADESKQAPENHDQLGCFALCPQRNPNRQANQPIAQYSPKKSFFRTKSHFHRRNFKHQGLRGFGQTAPLDHQPTEKRRTNEIADEAHSEQRDNRSYTHSFCQPANGENHVVPSKQFRSSKNDQAQGNTKRGTHDQFQISSPARSSNRTPNGKNQGNTKPQIDSSQSRQEGIAHGGFFHELDLLYRSVGYFLHFVFKHGAYFLRKYICVILNSFRHSELTTARKAISTLFPSTLTG